MKKHRKLVYSRTILKAFGYRGTRAKVGEPLLQSNIKALDEKYCSSKAINCCFIATSLRDFITNRPDRLCEFTSVFRCFVYFIVLW